MDTAKHKMQNRFEQWKTAASQLISGSQSEPGETDEATVLDLDPGLLDQCQLQADKQHTTVSTVINHILHQYWSETHSIAKQAIPRDQLERNPLLYLDGLSKREFTQYRGETYAEK
ncbi:hypothetical protein [Paenibacillus agricola]|uniref:CopG family transcriptional regulator n=1 Tax=Paenibacillus agricola TaxID=2716264 RepID=A0ABX0J571_9BACL|nr:hypothetical protein [Paenibacillus agricola]NHN30580.1 hypothetical protein [Paenibacillus agricola]